MTVFAEAEQLDVVSTPQSTIDAIMYSVRVRGVAALQEPANLERLAHCDEDARRQINERVEKLFFSEANAR